MSFRNKALLLSVLASCALGWLARPLAAPEAESEAGRGLRALGPALGQGISLAALGGYSDVAANLVWIRLNRVWEQRDREDVIARLRIATALSPESTFFWINGARIIANDMPVWEVGDANMGALRRTEAGRATRARYGRMALEFLDDAPPELAKSQDLLVERAVIHWRKLGDLEGAAALLREVVERPGSPYYLSRVYAELLVQRGMLREALAFLEAHYAGLPDADPRALKPVVAQRIRELRARLGSLNLPPRPDSE